MEHAETRGKEFFHLLFIMTGGDAKTAIKNSEDGLLAWATLWKTYNRPTLAKTLRMYKDATIPKVATHPGEIISCITEWEANVKELTKEEGIEIDPMIQVATLTEICTADIKDMIYQQGDDLFQNRDKGMMKTAFTALKEKIISWTSNRVASTAMDVGNFQVH